MEKRIAIHSLKLPKEIITEILEYLYYTPQQIAIRELYKRVHFSIRNSVYVNNYWYDSYYYLFNYKRTVIYICFCTTCGDYKYSTNMGYRVMCKC